MTLADLPVLNPSSPGREAKRAAVVAALFAIFGALYALARAAALAPRDLSASTDPVFGFAYPRGWGIAPSAWDGAASWPTRIAAAGMESTLAVIAVIVMAIALVIVMHPDILSRQGPQYVSPARRITTVIIAFVLAFLMYVGVQKIDNLFTSTITSNPDGARRQLVGFAALSVILFGTIWSFIGPKDFGRRIPLRISHGALGGLAVWGAIFIATLLSSAPRGFLSSSLDTFVSLLTVDAANSPGATAGWALKTDVLTAAVAMAVAGVMLVVTAPQSLGPGNRRGSAMLGAVLGLFLAVVAFTTYTDTNKRAATVNYNVTEALQLQANAPPRAVVILAGPATPANQRVARMPVVPTQSTADDCMHASGDDRQLPAATASNIQKLGAWIDAHGSEVSGASIRVTSCRAALQALRWEPQQAREGVLMSPRPERAGFLTYYITAPNVSSAVPASLSRMLRSMSDTARYLHGSEAAPRFADLARIAGDSALEASWRQRIIQPASPASMSSLLARPAYTDGSVTGRVMSSKTGWRIGLLAVGDPSTGADPVGNMPRSEGQVLSSMVAALDVAADGRFSFEGLRDGFYQLALLAPEGSQPAEMTHLTVRSDPGVFRLEPARKSKDVGVIVIDY